MENHDRTQRLDYGWQKMCPLTHWSLMYTPYSTLAIPILLFVAYWQEDRQRSHCPAENHKDTDYIHYKLYTP